MNKQTIKVANSQSITTQTVYCLIEAGVDGREPQTIEGIFSTEKKAKAAGDSYRWVDERQAIVIGSDVYLLDEGILQPCIIDQNIEEQTNKLIESALKKLTPAEQAALGVEPLKKNKPGQKGKKK